MKKYSGQAIAIIMIVLVVATVIGASLYSRMIQNSGEVVDTRESQRALEQADSILDAFISSDLGVLQSKIRESLAASNGAPVIFPRISELDNYFNTVPLIASDVNILDNIGWCDSDLEMNSSIEVSIDYADETSPVYYDVGDVMAINLNGVSSIPAGCNINLGLQPGGSEDHLFSIKYIYMDKVSGDVSPYKLDDMLLYCAKTQDENSCGDESVAPTSSIVAKVKLPGQINISNATLTTPNLYEIRLIPLKEKVGVSVLPDSCGDVFSNYRIRAKVNCKGDVREKQVVIPSVNNMGYSALFDYTIYNSNGSLSPN